MIRLTKPQFQVLVLLKTAAHLVEVVTPLAPFRTLGARVMAERRYFLCYRAENGVVTRRVRYHTFYWLFKHCFIEVRKLPPMKPLRDSDYPIHYFYLTKSGEKALETVARAPRRRRSTKHQ